MGITSESVRARLAELLRREGYDVEKAPRDFENVLRAWTDGNDAKPVKGLILMGPAGTGKSTIGKVLSRPGHRYYLGEGRTNELPAGNDPDLALGGWLLDDLGREPIRNDYGIKSETFPVFIQSQYRVRKWTIPPIITTNYGISELVKRYDGHTVSRLAELFGFVQMKAADHRRLSFRIYS